MCYTRGYSDLFASNFRLLNKRPDSGGLCAQFLFGAQPIFLGRTTLIAASFPIGICQMSNLFGSRSGGRGNGCRGGRGRRTARTPGGCGFAANRRCGRHHDFFFRDALCRHIRFDISHCGLVAFIVSHCVLTSHQKFLSIGLRRLFQTALSE